MAEARELTNNELKDLAGFSLTGDDNKELEGLGLITTDRGHKPYSHTLTPEGEKVLDHIHTTAPPKGNSSIRSLFTLLANIQRATGLMSQLFKEKTSVAVDVETRIRSAYAALPKQPDGWVGLADLRDRLVGLSRSEVDAALGAMARKSGVRIIPVANTQSLQQRDRDAALRLGDEDNHVISIGYS
jgi:hypothetical protein